MPITKQGGETRRSLRNLKLTITNVEPLPYNALIQQFYIENVLVLSTGNLLHCYLLTLINPTLAFYHPFTQTELDALKSHRYLHNYASKILDGIEQSIALYSTPTHKIGTLPIIIESPRPTASPRNRPYPSPRDRAHASPRGNGRQHLRLSLRTAYSTTPQFTAPLVEQQNKLACEIANKITDAYYCSLNLTLDNLTAILKEYRQQLTDEFIELIIHTPVDMDRYELLALLPDRHILKAAAENLTSNPLMRLYYKIRNEITSTCNYFLYHLQRSWQAFTSSATSQTQQAANTFNGYLIALKLKNANNTPPANKPTPETQPQQAILPLAERTFPLPEDKTPRKLTGQRFNR